MDEFYRGYRIAVKQAGERWAARITHARGTLVALEATATLKQGAAHCLADARAMVDRYVAFLEQNGIDGKPD